MQQYHLDKNLKNMKRTISLLVVAFAALQLWAQPVINTYRHNINYFIPQGFNEVYNPSVPQPKDVLGFEVGEQFADWNDVLKYMEALEESSGRVSIKKYGKTYQNRRFIQVAITSPENQKNLENIRVEHLKLTDNKLSGSLDIKKMPLVEAL